MAEQKQLSHVMMRLLRLCDAPIRGRYLHMHTFLSCFNVHFDCAISKFYSVINHVKFLGIFQKHIFEKL